MGLRWVSKWKWLGLIIIGQIYYIIIICKLTHLDLGYLLTNSTVRLYIYSLYTDVSSFPLNLDKTCLGPLYWTGIKLVSFFLSCVRMCITKNVQVFLKCSSASEIYNTV